MPTLYCVAAVPPAKDEEAGLKVSHSIGESRPLRTIRSRFTRTVAGHHPTVQLWLKPDVAAAERYATAVATPGSVLFHHYLSPAAYTARFGASQAAAAQVESWLHGQGLTGITADSGRAYVRATAPASRINAAFRIRLTLYKPSATVNAGRVLPGEGADHRRRPGPGRDQPGHAARL
jgi:subtilase family serine protease